MRRCLIILLWCLSTSVASAEVIELLTYHNHPPFVNGPGEGDTYRLAEHLNAIAPADIRFSVTVMPRVRLNQRLQGWIDGHCPASACATNWIVPWVNPKWGFRPATVDPYRWLPMTKDANIILSRRDAAIDYQGPDSLDGKVLAGIRGHRYVGIDERVQQRHIERIDGNFERENLLMLLYGRVDAVLLPESTVRYFIAHDPLIGQRSGELFLAPQPHQRYERFAMLPEERGDLQQLLQRALSELWLNSN